MNYWLFILTAFGAYNMAGCLYFWEGSKLRCGVRMVQLYAISMTMTLVFIVAEGVWFLVRYL